MTMLKSALVYVLANAVGLALAALILPNFRIDFWSFVIVVLVFSVILAVLTPLIRDIAQKQAPALMGAIALLTVGAGLFVTSLLLAGMELGGLLNWVVATLLVWAGSLAASLILPRYILASAGAPAEKK